MVSPKRTAYFALFAALATAFVCVSWGANGWVDASSVSVEVTRPAIPFVEGYEQGCSQARQEGKPMLVFFKVEWCSFCHKMATETFVDPEVVDLSSRFVCVEVDAEAEPEICQQLRVRGYPTVQFLSAQGTPLNRVVGKRTADQLVLQMQAALGATASRTSPAAMR